MTAAQGGKRKRQALLQEQFRKDLAFFFQTQPRVGHKLLEMVEECLRTPFEGTGKPEPLKHDLAGYWSRQITKADRVVYRVTDEFVDFVSARYHYE